MVLQVFKRCSADDTASANRADCQTHMSRWTKRHLHDIGVVLQVLERSSAEEAESRGVVIAAVYAADPEGAAGGLQESGGNALHLPRPHLGLHVCVEEVLHQAQAPHLRARTG